MTSDEIRAAIPHREPFLLIDSVIEREKDRIVCERTFQADEYFFAGHFPGRPIVPGVLLCEAAMQAGAVLLSSGEGLPDGAIPVATRMTNVRFKRMVQPGDVLRIEVRLNERLADAFFLSAKVSRHDGVVARLEFACTMAPAEGPP